MVGRAQLQALGFTRALLAAGPGAVASHRTAAALWRILPSMPQLIEVTVSDRRPRQRKGIKIHHANELEATTLDGIPVTTALRTLDDIDDERAWAEELLRSSSERVGSALPGACERSIRRRYRPDFLWPEHKLVVETDGWRAHGHRAAFEADRARDADLQASGHRVLRFTWRQVMDETLLVVVRIAQCTPHHALATPPAGG